MKSFIVFLLIFLFIHTNSEAQIKITNDFKFKTLSIQRNDYLVPLILLGTSFVTLTDNGILDNHVIQDARNEWMPGFHSRVDDYLQYAPIAMVFASDLLGVSTKNKFWNQTILLAKAELFTGLMILPLKYLSKERRPDYSNDLSFPSGHTAEAFMAATFVHKELGDRSIYFSLAAYTAASMVGLLRIANNKHWASDVLAGAAIGILATNLSYKILVLSSDHQVANHINFTPAYYNKHFQLSLSMVF